MAEGPRRGVHSSPVGGGEAGDSDRCARRTACEAVRETAECGGGSWESEVSWDLTYDGNIIASGVVGSYQLDLTSGDFELLMHDSYGDGWNGCVLNVAGTDYTFTSGSEATYETVLYAGTYEWIFTPQSYQNETSWDVWAGEELLFSGTGNSGYQTGEFIIEGGKIVLVLSLYLFLKFLIS
mgnify:CR=1 FL=1